MIDLLIRHGADINGVERNGVGIVHQAALTGNIRLVKKVIELGADPLYIGAGYAQPYTPHHSSRLLTSSLKNRSTPLCNLDAETKARQEIALYLIERGVSVNVGRPVHSTHYPGYVKFLVEHGADPFVVDEPEHWYLNFIS